MIVSLQTMSRSLGLALACTLLALANEVRAADLVLPQAKPVKLAGDFKFTERNTNGWLKLEIIEILK